jgi:hypothetical protein
MGRSRRPGRLPDEQARVDSLANEADALEMRTPGTALAVEAAERSVAAAEQLVAASGTLDSRRRLVRALSRQTASYAAAGDDIPGAVRSAERCWVLCLEVVDAARPDPEVLDEVAGLVVNAAGVVAPVLVTAGRQQDAEQVTQACIDVAASASGPRSRQARARLAIMELAADADEFAQERAHGWWQETSGAVEQALGKGRNAVEVLRGHAAEGPYDALDLARMLQVVSRLETVAGRLAEAAAALDEAISVLTPIAERGPRFAWFLRGMRGERDGLRGHVPRTPAGTQDSSSLPADRAFRRAARDLGDGIEDAFPRDLAAAAAAVQAVSQHKARRGLAMAWYARLLTTAGQPAQASDTAAEAVRLLMRFSDQPDRTQAALVVTLNVLAIAARRAGNHQAAQQAELQAGRIFPQLGRRDPAYFTDLAPE